MTIAIYIAGVFLVCGIVLIAWALFNPRWRSADAYDMYGPLLLGCFAVVSAAAIGIATALLWVIQNHLRG